MTTRALVMFTKYASRVSIPGDRANSYAFRFNHGNNRVFDPDGAFTLVAGTAVDGPGDYIQANRDSVVEIQFITSLNDDTINIPNFYLMINDGQESGTWQDIHFQDPSEPFGSIHNWCVSHGQTVDSYDVLVPQLTYKGILKDGWRVFVGMGGSLLRAPTTVSDGCTLMVYEILDDMSSLLLPGQDFPPPL